MRNRLKFNILKDLDIDFIGIVNKFHTDTTIEKVEYLGTLSVTPDNHYHKIFFNNKTYYIYEVDYISSLEYEVEEMKKILGQNIQLIKVKKPSLDFKSPIANHITNYSGLEPFYHKFLIGYIINN